MMVTGFINQVKEKPIEAIGTDASEALSLTKSYLDSVISSYKSMDSSNKTAIDQLTVEGLDANQVWWQTKMVLDSIEGDLMERIRDLKDVVNAAGSASFEEDEGEISERENEDISEQEENGVMDVSDSEEEIIEGEDDYIDSDIEQAQEEEEQEEESTDIEETEEKDETEVEEPERLVDDKNSLNDEFFDIEEFNRQTLAQENDLDEDNNDSEEIDYFADLVSDEDEEADYYEDFFDKPKSKQSKPKTKKISSKQSDNDDNQKERDNEEEEDGQSAMNFLKYDLFEDADVENEDETNKENGKKLSTFEKEQLEIQKQIKQLEEEAVAEKKWALKGEVKAKDRPDDALLTEDLEFERTAKPVPVITTEVTETLEEMIRKRIQEFNFDDLQRRTVNDFAKRGQRQKVEISDVKSSKSLAELYADDYQGVSEEADISEELQKSHGEITELFNIISYKLDALSSAHFIPRPTQKSLEVRVETAAITMEDAQPLSMSSASTLAPQEIYKAGKADNDSEIRLKNGTVMARDELTREDKTRLRRSIKRKRAKNMANQQHLQQKKKSKKDDVIETLSHAKNITVINQRGEKHDVKGNVKSNGTNNNVNNLRL